MNTANLNIYILFLSLCISSACDTYHESHTTYAICWCCSAPLLEILSREKQQPKPKARKSHISILFPLEIEKKKAAIKTQKFDQS